MADKLCPWCRGYSLEMQWCHVCKGAGYIPDARARWNLLQTAQLNLIARATAALTQGPQA